MHLDLDFKKVLSEIEITLSTSNFENLAEFVNKIINANKIVVFGAGRVGLMMKTFAMRLNHLNMQSFFIGDLNLSKTGAGDLLIIGSGSGNTKSVVSIGEIAKTSGLDIISITSNLDSLIANISSSVIHLNCETKNASGSDRKSIQPMTTLFEQSLLIFLDSLVLILMKKLNENHESMLKRHNVIE